MHDTDARNPLDRLRTWFWVWWPVVVVSLPIAVAAVRAAAGEWVPTGDDAYFTVRSRDVLTGHHPLLGAWSSGSVDLDTPINNLGPLQLDLLAPFTRWFPMGGTAIGTAALNVAAVVAMAWVVRRLAGREGLLAAMVGVGLVAWTMGSEMLITPRQHQAMILPFLCLLVAAWAVTAGDRVVVPIAVAAASVVAQTHLSYPVLCTGLAVAMIAGQVIATRAGTAVGSVRWLVGSGVLLIVLWSQTLIEQFAGDGNFGEVVFGSGDAGRAGWSAGSRIMARILLSVDTITRPGYRRFDTEAELASTWVLIVFWVVVIAAVAGVAWLIVRRGWTAASGPLVAVVAVVTGVIDAALLPPTTFGLQIANYRWLWAIGAFVALLLVASVLRRYQTRPLAVSTTAGATAAVAVVVLAVVNVPRSVQHTGAERYLDEQAAVASMLDQLGAALDSEQLGTVVVDDAGMHFGHGFTYPLLIELQEHDVDFRFTESVQERRFGSKRLADGSERHRLRLLSGEAALAAQESPDLIGFVDVVDQPVALVLEDV